VSLPQVRNYDVTRLVKKFFWVNSSGQNFQLKECSLKVKRGERAVKPVEINATCEYNRKRCELLLDGLSFIYGMKSTRRKGIFHPVMERIILYLWGDTFLEQCMLKADAAKRNTVARYILRYAFSLVSPRLILIPVYADCDVQSDVARLEKDVLWILG
jgi:hypothetical protein